MSATSTFCIRWDGVSGTPLISTSSVCVNLDIISIMPGGVG